MSNETERYDFVAYLPLDNYDNVINASFFHSLAPELWDSILPAIAPGRLGISSSIWLVPGSPE